MRIVELRSDTKTKPTLQMREAMFSAEVGDDVSGEDPTVNRLEALGAEMLGKEAALFVASGTMGNLVSVLTHCRRGHEVILGEWAHIYWAEVAGAAALGGISYRPLPNEPDGSLDLRRMEQGIRPPDAHYPETGLICLESTHNRMGGLVLSLDYMAAVRSLADRHGLNAATYLRVPASEISRYADSVQICLSKGLGAPVGSLVAGTSAFIVRARKTRKMLGGGMRQAGVIAAAGIVALERHVQRLEQDQSNARLLAEGLAAISGLEIDLSAVQTNIVNVRMAAGAPTAEDFEVGMAAKGVLFHAVDEHEVRMVTHLDVSRSDIVWALGRMEELLAA